jgi:hypothetical protein
MKQTVEVELMQICMSSISTICFILKAYASSLQFQPFRALDCSEQSYRQFMMIIPGYLCFDRGCLRMDCISGCRFSPYPMIRLSMSLHSIMNPGCWQRCYNQLLAVPACMQLALLLHSAHACTKMIHARMLIVQFPVHVKRKSPKMAISAVGHMFTRQWMSQVWRDEMICTYLQRSHAEMVKIVSLIFAITERQGSYVYSKFIHHTIFVGSGNRRNCHPCRCAEVPMSSS